MRLGIGYENTRYIYKAYLKDNRRIKNAKGLRKNMLIQTSEQNYQDVLGDPL